MIAIAPTPTTGVVAVTVFVPLASARKPAEPRTSASNEASVMCWMRGLLMGGSVRKKDGRMDELLDARQAMGAVDFGMNPTKSVRPLCGDGRVIGE